MRLFLALILLVLAGLATTPADARSSFELSVCNNTDETVWVATSRIRGDRWVVSGWWDVEAYDCRSLGSYPKPK